MQDGPGIIDYLGGSFASLEERPLSDVDSLALACLSYYRLPDGAAAARGREGMALHEIYRADWFGAMTEGLWDPEGLVRLLSAIVASPRLRDARLCDYVEDLDVDAEKQFCACTLRFPSGDSYVSFRGTDNSIVGWKEDFNMAFERDVPSQVAARAYLERAARRVPAGAKLWAGGHSKGGNLAVYAAMTCDEATYGRLERVYSHDGPGFMGETLASADWASRQAKVSKTVPESSLIGMMFESQEDYAVVRSRAIGAFQHDPFSWVVEGDGFAEAESLSRGAALVDQGLNQWISGMSREEREGFVNTLFSVLYASGQDTLAGVKSNLQETLPAMLAQLKGLDEEQRGYLVQAVGQLVRAFAPEIELPSMASVERSVVPAAIGRRFFPGGEEGR